MPSSPRALRRWKVLHACGAAADVAVLAEAQLGAGMYPSVLSRETWNKSAPPSLLRAWSDVKHWRSEFAAIHAVSTDLVHAHEFACGMAALRAGFPVVYDFAEPVEEFRALDIRPGIWLRRSMRAAEQFLLGRAAAVVTHSNAMWDKVLERGVAPDNLFLVPEAVQPAAEAPAGSRQNRVTLFTPEVQAEGESPELEALLEACAFVKEEIEGARLLLRGEAISDWLRQQLCAKELTESVVVRPDAQAAHADLVISFATGRGPDPIAIDAMAQGKALLAADRAAAREVSADGRGCLWFRAGDARDLGYRAAFLARNADFRASLGAAGQAHIAATRGPAAVANMYDEVYRHAVNRKPSPTDFLPSTMRTALVCI